MIRHASRRVGQAPRRLDAVRLASSTAPAAAAAARAAVPDEPYGNAYGPGPSRLPYTPPRPSIVGPSRPAAARGPTRHSAHELRHRLAELSPGSFSNPDLFARALGRDPGTLSRLETHALFHYLIRTRRGLLAAALITAVIEHGLAARPHGRRRVFAPATLRALFTSTAIVLPPPRPSVSTRSLPEQRKLPYFNVSKLRQPSIAEQRPHALTVQTTLLLSTLDALRRIRHARPRRIYELLIRQCLAERRPDEAAKVYVGLVEEWIVEGRVAEGADPADFSEGGGPARAPATWSPRSSSLLSLWFGGVRTWRLPGEALSLHDRLDLWHPRHLALGEKLRGFPLPVPTSPPSLVPQPAVRLLQPILDALVLDPRQAEPAAYASTMRALAILANPVLNRTLPVPAVPALLKAFGGSPVVPEVYPESFTEVPERNSWAYTANTQVHVALVSLLWSPPNFAHASLLSERLVSPDQPLPLSSGAAAYKLPPLSWRSCLVLLEYGAARLRQPRLLGRLVDYMRDTWVSWNTHAVNLLFRGGAGARDRAVVREMDDALFGRTRVARGENGDKGAEPADAVFGLAAANTGAAIRVDPDEQSLVDLVRHLGKSGDAARLRAVIYQLAPFLSFRRSMTSDDVAALCRVHGLEPGPSGRPAALALTSRLYSAIVAAVAAGGHTGLAQRVFVLATKAELAWVAAAARDGGVASASAPASASGAPPAPRLGIDIFTTMLSVFAREAERARAAPHTRARGWAAPGSARGRHGAASAAAADVYNRARGRWLAALRAGEAAGALAPDARFFNAAIAARAHAWQLGDGRALPDAAAAEMARVVEDMRTFGVPVPPGLLAKLGTGRADGSCFVEVDDTRGRARAAATERAVWVPIKREMARARRGARGGRQAAEQEHAELAVEDGGERHERRRASAAA